MLALAGFMVERGRRVGELVDGPDGGRPRRSCPWCSSSSSPTSEARSCTCGALAGSAVPLRRALAPPRDPRPDGAPRRRERSVVPSRRRESRCSSRTRPARLTGFTNPDSDPGGPDLQRDPVADRGRRRWAVGSRRRGGESDPPRLPPRARDGLRLRVVCRAAWIRRHLDPAAPLPARRVARASRHHRRRRSLRRGRRRGNRLRVPLPDLRQRRDDDGHRSRDRDPAAVRHGRGLLDGREPRWRSACCSRFMLAAPRRGSAECRPGSGSVRSSGSSARCGGSRARRPAIVDLGPRGRGARGSARGGGRSRCRSRSTAIPQRPPSRFGSSTVSRDARERAVLRRLVQATARRWSSSAAADPRGSRTCSPTTSSTSRRDEQGTAEIAAAIARAAGADGPSLAARLPVLRAPVARRLIAHDRRSRTPRSPRRSRKPAAAPAARRSRRPACSCCSGSARGDVLPRDPEELAARCRRRISSPRSASGIGARARRSTPAGSVGRSSGPPSPTAARERSARPSSRAC